MSLPRSMWTAGQFIGYGVFNLHWRHTMSTLVEACFFMIFAFPTEANTRCSISKDHVRGLRCFKRSHIRKHVRVLKRRPVSKGIC